MTDSTGSSSAWSLPEVVDYFLADPEISENIDRKDLHDIVNVKADWVKLVRTALEYQGFDPRVILAQLLRHRKTFITAKNALVEWDLSNVGGGLACTSGTIAANKFSNQESLAKDINFLIKVFLARNNHIGKILKNARTGVDDILNMLKEKYMIDDEMHLNSRTITLPRIAGVFPGTAVRMFHDKTVKEIVPYDLFPGPNKPGTHAICCPLLPSVCPTSLTAATGDNFHSVMLWTAIKLDDIIHRREKDTTPIIELLGYYRAGYQSAAVPEKSKVSIFRHVDLIVEKKGDKGETIINLTTEAKALSSSCFTQLGSMRRDDEHHDLLIKVAKNGDMNLF